jgi:hypothetical protein
MARFILVLPVLAAFVATAQQQAKIEAGADDQLVSKVENAIRGAEPEWHYTRAILDAPPPIVPSERVLVAGVWEHDLETGTRDDVHLDLFRVDSRPDAEMSLSEVRDGKVAKGWRVRRFHIGDEGYLLKFRNGERFELHFRKGTIIVRVSSNSFRLVQRFAELAAAQLDTI